MTTTTDATDDCEAVRYASERACNAVRVAVIYSDARGVERERHVACGVHAVAEVDRHEQSRGIAQVRTEPLRWPAGAAGAAGA